MDVCVRFAPYFICVCAPCRSLQSGMVLSVGFPLERSVLLMPVLSSLNHSSYLGCWCCPAMLSRQHTIIITMETISLRSSLWLVFSAVGCLGRITLWMPFEWNHFPCGAQLNLGQTYFRFSFSLGLTFHRQYHYLMHYQNITVLKHSLQLDPYNNNFLYICHIFQKNFCNRIP